MSQDTPRTDEHEANLTGCCQPVVHFHEMAEFARKLEREIAEMKNWNDCVHGEAKAWKARSEYDFKQHVHAEAVARQLERKIERQAERIRYLEGATNHAGGTPLAKAIKERDEARKFARKYAFRTQALCYDADKDINGTAHAVQMDMAEHPEIFNT